MKQARALLNYMKLLDKCISLEPSRDSGEWHHVLPKSLFTTYRTESWNLVRLTRKEHIFAHHMLFEFYERNGEMARAYNLMVNITGKSESSKLAAIRVSSLSEVNRQNALNQISRGLNKFADSKFNSENQIRRIEEGNHQFLDSDVQSKNSARAYSIEYQCPFCDKSGNGLVFKTNHFDHCKENPNQIKRKYKLKVCPHCQKEDTGPNMSRYHFDKCRMNPLNLTL